MTTPPIPPASAAATTNRELHLHAFSPQAALWQRVRTEAPADIGRIDDLLDSWEAAQARVAQLRGEPLVAPPDAVIDVPEALTARLTEIVTEPLFEQTFSVVPSRVALVELDHLVAPQRTVDLEFVDALVASLPRPPSLADLVELCLGPNGTVRPVRHVEVTGDRHVFTSPDRGLRHLGSVVRDLRLGAAGGGTAPGSGDDHAPLGGGPVLGGVPAMAIVTYVGFGTPAMNALAVGDRLILNNGFHRAYALRSIGVERVPMVVQQIRHPERELPALIAGVPRAELVDGPRPAILADFFDPALTVVLDVERRAALVSLRVDVTEHDIPG